MYKIRTSDGEEYGPAEHQLVQKWLPAMPTAVAAFHDARLRIAEVVGVFVAGLGLTHLLRRLGRGASPVARRRHAPVADA